MTRRFLDPTALTAATAAYCDVPVKSMSLDHRTGPLRKAIARAIHAYQDAIAEAEPKKDAA